MRTLSEVFAPGSPTLPEGLRTLVVSPERELEPGMTVRAQFTFRNQGGAPATGVRVRFNVPEGLVYLVGSGELDGSSLDDELGNTPLLSRAGAQIGDVMPGEERRLTIAYSVAGAIENGSTVELQAAVASFEVPPVGSNVVRLIARSRPQLQNAMTTVHIEARRDAAPGSEAQILVRVHNAGESSAHDVVVVAPIPQHTTYVPNSIRVNGREIERELGTSFDRAYAPVVVPTLAASASATLLYRVRIDDPLPDGSVITATAQIASQEMAAFELDSSSFTVASQPDFSDDRTTFTVDPAYDVQPGGRVTLRMTATNTGTAPAESVHVDFALSEHAWLVKGATRIDGRAIKEKKKEATGFDLGRIDKHDTVEIVTEAIVATPLPNGGTLPIAATLTWQPHRDISEGTRRFERTVVVRSEPFLHARRNAIVRTGDEVIRPGDEVEANIALTNDGSAPLTDVVVQLRIDPALEEVRLFEKSARVVMEGGDADLGTLEPYTSRTLTVRARVRSPYPNRGELKVGASVHSRELGETRLGETNWRVDSHPVFTQNSSKLELASDSVLRPNQLADVFLRLRNDGSDAAHNVRMRLYISPEARFEQVEGATRERSTIAFGEIPPGGHVEARLGLRLLRSLVRTYPVTVDAVITADSMLPVPLERLTIETNAEPDFSIGTFRSEPVDSVDVGEMIEWTLHVRNGGDGPARHVTIAIEQPASLIYVPNSTTVNDIPVRDVGAKAPFASERGIIFNDVDPGIEATIRWRDVVHNGLPAGEAIERVAKVAYDGDRTDEIVAPDLHVRAAPAFANTIPGLPFGIDGMLGTQLGGVVSAPAIDAERYLQLPPATPVNGGQSHVVDERPHYLALDATNGHLDAHVVEPGPPMVGTLVAFSAERFARTLRLLDQTRFEGLVSHLFAIRAFFPDALGDAHGAALLAQRDVLRETVDRLFIKLRVPNYVIDDRDIETPSARATLERFIAEVARERGVPSEPPATALALRGEVPPETLAELGERLGEAPLASATPWFVLAHLLPTTTAEAVAYRDALTHSLEEILDAEPREFLDALQRRAYPELDEALTSFRDSLGAARMRTVN